MQKHKVGSVEELKTVLCSFGPDALYRGQVGQFGSEDAPKMNTSFSRGGCTPPLMLRWSHYASFALAALLGRDQQEISLEFTQAVLQHYGWRSFFLDASSDPAVSAWFASHIWSANRSIELCEDCFEDPLFLIKLMAKYDYQEGTGYLYILSKAALAQKEIGLVDLESIELPGFRPRFRAQQAWILGPTHTDLPIDCLLASIEAPRIVFRDYATEKGFVTTDDLFPDIQQDPVLEILTSMPWKHRRLPAEKSGDLKYFEQAFELPEYHDSFRKHNPPHIAYYEGESSGIEKLDSEAVVFDAPEIIVFGFANPVATKFPAIAKILKGEGQHFVFEIDSLVRRPGRLSSEYLKGVAISKQEDGLVSVADFAVDHPGRQMHGCGINAGWHYRIADDGTWDREITSHDCPCGNNSIHHHHLSMLTIVDDLLRSDPPSVIQRKAAKAVG